jgi:hypothetical protein
MTEAAASVDEWGHHGAEPGSRQRPPLVPNLLEQEIEGGQHRVSVYQQHRHRSERGIVNWGETHGVGFVIGWPGLLLRRADLPA